MRPDLEVLATSPDLAVNVQKTDVAIRCRIVRTIPEAALPNADQGTERYIHLGLTVADAMRLLAVLQNAQETLGLPVPQATGTFVPPDKDRH